MSIFQIVYDMRNSILIIMATALVMAGCTKTETQFKGTGQMRLAPCLPGTKATDTSFENGDAIGTYVVEYADGTPSPLQISGNWSSNAKATFDGSNWSVSPTIWWKDDAKFDVYAYYPYDEQQRSVDSYLFSVQKDQRDAGFTKSDLMWAKTGGVTRSENPVTLNFSHKLSRLDINLIKGADYEGDLPSEVEVKVMGTTGTALLDIETGDVEKNPYGTEADIIAHKNGIGSYSAIIVPQKILNQIPLVEIVAGDVSYLVSSRFIFESGKRHTLNITLSSDPNKVIINIGGGIEDWNS